MAKANLDSGYIEPESLRVFFDAGSDIVRITSNDEIFGASGLNVAIKRDSPGDHAARLALARSGISIVPAQKIELTPTHKKAYLVEDVEVDTTGALSAQLGVGEEGPVMLDLNEEHPHLAIYGASGSGKSALVRSLVFQWLQQPCEMWMVEPASELQLWRSESVWNQEGLPRSYHRVDRSQVTRFVDSWSGQQGPNPAGTMRTLAEKLRDEYKSAANRPQWSNSAFVAQVRSLLSDAVGEMNARLLKASSAVRVHSGEQEEMKSYLAGLKPLVILIESAEYYFGSEPDFAIMASLNELLRKGGQVNVHVVLTAQRADNNSVPSLVREQMTAVGMKTLNAADSRIIIGQPGLEDINFKGVGVLKAAGKLTVFRSLWMND